MGKTISTHNGSVANREHNIRNPRATDKQEHIDKSLKEQNEVLHDEKPREAYRRIFGEALADYNAKQSRPERQIRDYFAHVSKDAKKHPVYEMIVQIGDRNDTGIDAPVERECLKEFYAGWKERNPNLECIGAYLHADEADGTVHMHIDYVPVATGYKKGMTVQNGLVKALEQQGFEKDGAKTAQIQWEARENAALEAICERHGIEVIHPMVEKRQHLDTEAYKAQQQAYLAYETYSQLQDSIDEIQADLESAKGEASKARAEAADLRPKLVEGMEMVKKLQGVTNALESKETALEDEIRALEGQKESLTEQNAELTEQNTKLTEQNAELERKLPALTAQISDARNELDIVERAVNRKMDEGERLFGMTSVHERIAKAREEASRERRRSLLERFIELPMVKPLWERFCHEQERQRPPKQKQKDISD